jgi:hypothetical protein
MARGAAVFRKAEGIVKKSFTADGNLPIIRPYIEAHQELLTQWKSEV